jgi:FlaA1/EpsC-like NDP-sugar epimerase
VSGEVLENRSRAQALRALARRRLLKCSAEAGFDSFVWLTCVATAARAGGVAHTGLQWTVVASGVPVLCATAAACGLLAGLYQGRYRRGSRDEVAGVLIAVATTALCLCFLGPLLVPGHVAEPSVVLGGALLAGIAMLGVRYLVFTAGLRSRFAAVLRSRPSAAAVKVIVFGAGDAGAQLVNRLVDHPDCGYEPVALLDDDPGRWRLRISGVPVLGDRNQIAAVAARTGARVMVIAIARPSGSVIGELTAEAERCGLVPKVIPSVQELLTGGARIEGVRDPRITDLLGRRPVETDVEAVGKLIAGRRILVTGAGGSIGSELCRQIHRFQPEQLILLDRDESALHAVQLLLSGRALLDTDETVLADLRDRCRIREVFERSRPHIVFHTAALKHLPLLESFPCEALKSNVLGTLNVLDAAVEYGVDSFVNISTDKAANPVSVLGYSKRITERLTAYVAHREHRAYLSVRFGNVLGSRGSVLTTLSAQVESGGPVTVTHPEVRRYFMTANEAVQLVLQAAVIGRGGEVLVLDMGEPVRIADIAQRLAAGADRDVDIVFTGLRPGEKLNEDLLGAGETDHRPRHPLISQVPVPPLEPSEVTGLDPGVTATMLRRALAACATPPSTVPEPTTRPAVSLPSARAAVTTVSGDDADLSGLPGCEPEAPVHTVRNANQKTMRLRSGPSMRPAQSGEAGYQAVQHGCGIGIRVARPASRIRYVVRLRVPQQFRSLSAGVGTSQPDGQGLASGPRADLIAAADEFFQRERPGPDGRQSDNGVPDVFPGHPEDEPGPAQVGNGDDTARVRSRTETAARDDLRHLWQQGRALADHSGRAHRHRGSHGAQPVREHRRSHRRPADVCGAQHQYAGFAAFRPRALPLLRVNHRPWQSLPTIKPDITEKGLSTLPGMASPDPGYNCTQRSSVTLSLRVARRLVMPQSVSGEIASSRAVLLPFGGNRCQLNSVRSRRSVPIC